jgi:hypothetical protein
MTARELQACILAAELTPTEKLTALAIATHWNERRQNARLYQRTLAAECGVSERTIRRAVHTLIEAQIFEAKVTGRSAIFLTGVKLNTSSVDRTPMSYQTGQKRHSAQPAPWELDTTFSTKFEEEYKRLRGQKNGKRESAADAD